MTELATLDFKRQIDRDGVPSPAAGIDMDLVRDCIHCGLCLPKCPTFRSLHHEGDSPRGRMWQIKEATLGLVAFDDPRFQAHVYQCLNCRACETACPSGVQFGTVMEMARAKTPPQATARARVGLLTGCIQDEMFRGTNRRTALALARNGCDVIVPAARVCCGALASHAGEAKTAEHLAGLTMDAFAEQGLDAVVVNAAGCGSNMKEYEVQLRNDARRREAAPGFSRTVKDASEFLISLGLRPPARPIRLKVAYQDPCHLVHGQKVYQQPRQVLAMIPGIELVEMKESDWCCGSAGVYNLTQPEISGEALGWKVRNIIDSGAQVIASANPGCILQVGTGLQRAAHDIPVVHVMDLLGWAYGDDEQRPPIVRRAMA